MTKKTIRDLVDAATDMARGAGDILREGFQKAVDVRYKGKIDPVTQFDLQSEEYIVGRIKEEFPEHRILAEEGTDKTTEAEFRWIIDPLDGTVNFAHGFPVYCVSIADEYRGQIVAGAVYDPERDELFAGGRSVGARLNDRRLRVSTETRLDRSMVATGFAYDVHTSRRNNIGYFGRMIKSAQAVRRPGSAAIDLCWLAAGRLDGFWELKLHPWDTAAAAMLVEEAGGRVTQLDGSPYTIFDDEILATNSRIHRAMSRALQNKK